MIRKTRRHSRCARRIPAWGLLSTPCVWPIQLELQRQVGTAEMVRADAWWPPAAVRRTGAGPLWVGAPPLEMGEQFARQLGRGPRATGQSRQSMTQGQIDSLHESGVERAGEPERLEPVGQAGEIAQAHATLDPSGSAAAIGLLDLAVQQVERHLPTEFAGSYIGEPLTEMGRDGVEVEVEAIAGEDGQTALSQDQ